MNKIVVISSNANKDYLFYVPFAEHAWNKIGWRVCLMITHDVDRRKVILNNANTHVYTMPPINGLRSETIAQSSRFYAASFMPDNCVMMTGDVDLLPLSDYWQPDPSIITVYGHDLTDYTHYPTGYIAMTRDSWRSVMGLKDDIPKQIYDDCVEIGMALSDDFGKWWNHDWTLSTKRIKPHHPHFHNRGKRDGTNFAFGRIDRGDSMQIPNEIPLIDMHCVNKDVRRPDVRNQFFTLYEKFVAPITFRYE